MKTIWKFPLTTTDMQEVEMPAFTEILTVDTQKGTPCLWGLLESDYRMETRTFEIIGTGHPMQEKLKRVYIGTYQLYEGSLIFHVFEIIK